VLEVQGQFTLKRLVGFVVNALPAVRLTNFIALGLPY
jgi:hypothetical protein